MKRFKLTIKLRLLFILAVACGLLVFIGWIGINGTRNSDQALGQVYNQNLKPTRDLATAMKLIQSNRITLMALLANPQPALVKSAAGKIAANQDKVDGLIDNVMATHSAAEADADADADAADLFTRLKQDRADLVATINKVLGALKAGDVSTARTLTNIKIGPAFATVLGDVDKLFDRQVKAAGASYDSAASVFKRDRTLAIAMISSGVVVILILGFFLLRSVMKSLNRAIGVADRIAKGQLGHAIEIKSNDETGRLLRSLKTMDERLHGIVTAVRTGSDSVSSAAHQIAQGNDDLSQRTQEQASSLEETASSMEEMTSTVRQNADNARQANQLAVGAREQAENGGKVAEKAVAAMSEINTSSTKIADIIGVIDEIAFQTNLLALNAAVEAARAGEQGRGFAVVATEVRNLAQRSATAAKEIKELIEDSVEKVKSGSELVDESGHALEEIVGSVKKVTDIVSEISAASQEQSTGIDQVNHAVTDMDDVTQQNAALVEEAAAASRSMEEQAADLTRQMAFFSEAGGAVAEAPAPAPAREAASAAPITVPATGAAAAPASDAPPGRRLNGGQRPASTLAAAQASAPEERDVWEEF